METNQVVFDDIIFRMRSAARAVVIRDNKLLVMKRNKFGDIYYVLPGGGIDSGETPEQAVVRELQEEACLDIKSYREILVEKPWGKFGEQHIFLCKDPGGEPKLHQDSVEAKLNKLGGNTYDVMWMALDDLSDVKFRSPGLQKKLVEYAKIGFPETTETI